MRRRTFLQTAGAALAGGLLAGRVAADGPPYPAQPDTVTIDYPESLLQAHRPELVIRDLEIRPAYLAAWRASSPDYEGDWLVYFAYYSIQRGVTDEDSHVPDREPVYVRLVDGEPDRILFDRYHYLVGSDPATTVVDGHPRLRVVDPWHPYQLTSESGTLVEIRDLNTKYESWLDAGWSVDRRSVVDPPSVQARGHWWPDNSLGLSLTAQTSRIWETIGCNPLRRT